MAAKERPLLIASLGVDRGGCGWYRIRQPFNAINEYTTSKAVVYDEKDDPIEFAKTILHSDIVVVRQGGEAGIERLKKDVDKYAEEIGAKERVHAKWVMDIDDNVELINPYSEHYKEYGVREFYDNNAKTWIWKDGENGFDLAHNRQKLMSFMNGLQKMDLITVTTPKLAEYARQYNDHVAILPNVINTHVWWKPEFKPNKQLRVIWSGGMSHYVDWYSIKDPLNAMMRKYQFKLILVGSGFTGVIEKDLHHLVEVWPWVPFEAHSYRMMLMQGDIAIIPLADEPFNHYKSAIKWFEMSAMGIPSLVANVSPYKEVMNAANSMAYGNAEEFINGLHFFLTSEMARKRIGSLARKEVLKNWTAEQHAKTYLDAYRAIL